MSAVYGHEVSEALEDPPWIEEMSGRGLVLLSKDARIRSAHLDVVVESKARLFLLPEQGLSGRAMSSRFVNSKHGIAVRSKKRGPFIYMVGPKKLTKVELPPKYPSSAPTRAH